MEIWMNWLLALTVVALAAISILGIVLNHRTQIRWMRIFCESQGIPAITTEVKPIQKEVVTPQPKPKKKLFSLPIPGAQMFKSR